MDSKSDTPVLGSFDPRSPSSNRTAFLWSISSLVLVAWLALWLWGQSPYSRFLEHGQLGGIGHARTPILISATLYIAGWTLMTIAMMLPTTLPLLEIFRRLTRQRREQLKLIALVILGYLAVWVCFGGAAHLADWLIHELVERSGWLEQNVWIIGASTLFMAGAFQFSRLKYRCLDKCRAPLSFVMEHWRGRHDYKNALLLGSRHGIFCVGCCWALMLLMFGVGVGNLGWMLALGVIMAMEKNMPWGRKLSAPLGVALLGCGAIQTLTHF